MRCLTTLIFITLCTGPSFAAIIHVPAEFSTIQLAIDHAGSGDTVIVQPGTYIENISFKGKKNLTVRSSVVTKPEYFTIDGNQSGAVVRFTGLETPTTVLWGFTITNGNNADSDGGGIRCEVGASPTIIENIIGYNSCVGNGGGIWCDVYESSPTITANSIHNNYAEGNGGGIFTQGYMESMTVHVNIPVIQKNIIVSNRADNYGGGIFCGNYSAPVIFGNSLLGNESDYCGGAIAGLESRPVIIGNRMMNNIAYYAGGGIFLDSLVFPDGEIFEIRVDNNLITCNSSENGGGVCMMNPDTDIMEFRNNTITLNRADSFGGGLFYEPGGNVDAYLNIIDTILWENTASDGYEIYHGAMNQKFAIDYSDVKGGGSAPFVVNVDPDTWGSSMIDSDPLFVEGLCGLYYLSQVDAGQATDAPCIDAGSDLASYLGMDSFWTRTDEELDSGTVDMGFHYGPHSSGWTVSFYSDVDTVSQSIGGSVEFTLNAGLNHASRNYIILGSLSGSYPGTPLPKGYAVLPLNWDIFTDLVLSLLNTYPLTHFLSVLDSRGSAKGAQLNFAPVPGSSGLTMYFAYAINNPWDFVSNPLVVTIIP
ncbi:MAG: hypothetical protein ABIK28_00910 [Planctomycetota bacterium]